MTQFKHNANVCIIYIYIYIYIIKKIKLYNYMTGLYHGMVLYFLNEEIL